MLQLFWYQTWQSICGHRKKVLGIQSLFGDVSECIHWWCGAADLPVDPPSFVLRRINSSISVCAKILGDSCSSSPYSCSQPSAQTCHSFPHEASLRLTVNRQQYRSAYKAKWPFLRFFFDLWETIWSSSSMMKELSWKALGRRKLWSSAKMLIHFIRSYNSPSRVSTIPRQNGVRVRKAYIRIQFLIHFSNSAEWLFNNILTPTLVHHHISTGNCPRRIFASCMGR